MNYNRVAELHDPYRRSGGTGYLIRDNLVLTAHHVIAPIEEPGTLNTLYDIRFIGDYDEGRIEWQERGCSLCWDDPEHDLALLKLEGNRPSFLPLEESIIRFGKLGSQTLLAQGCGFPLVQRIDRRQNPEPLNGHLSRIAGLREKQLRLQITSLIPNSSEEWQGISGTALFVEDYLVGVVIETRKAFNEKALWAIPVSHLVHDNQFCQLLLDNTLESLPLFDLENHCYRTQKLENFTVKICHSNDNSNSAIGTGIFISTKGHILTCRHVLEDAKVIAQKKDSQSLWDKLQSFTRKSKEVKIYFPNAKNSQKEYRARIKALLPEPYEDDIALLEIVGDFAPLLSEQVALLGCIKDIITELPGVPFRSHGFFSIKDVAMMSCLCDGFIDWFVPSLDVGPTLLARQVLLKTDQFGNGMRGAGVMDMKRNLIVGLISKYQTINHRALAVDAHVLTFSPMKLRRIGEIITGGITGEIYRLP